MYLYIKGVIIIIRCQSIGNEVKMKKVFAVLFVLILLTGCTTKEKNALDLAAKESVGSNNKEESGLSIKGRYIETDLPLPETFDKSTTLQLTKKDGMPFLYAFSYSNAIIITGYRMNEDGSWSEETPEWLKSDTLPKEDFYEPTVFEDRQGNQYIYYLIIKDGVYNGRLLCSNDGTTHEIINPEGWSEVSEESMFHNTPGKLAALEDGTLVALFYSGDITFYNKDNYTIQKSIIGESYAENILRVADKSVILGKTDKREMLVGIDIYDTKDSSKVTYPYQSDFAEYTNTYIDINDKKEMALCSEQGVHVLEEGTSLWQTIVDGDLTSLSMKTMYPTGFVAASDMNYYILYGHSSQNGYSFMKYSYDETVNAVPSNELNIYSLKDNPTLRQASALFRQTYPDIKINFNIVMTDEEYRNADQTIKDDYIRALNTELLSGNGPDILVLDDLPVDSLIEKGVLTDMSDIIQPMIDKEELYTDIISNYKTDDKVYYIPARFIPRLLCGRTLDAENISTLNKLADYMENHTNKTIFGKMTLEDFINTFAPYITGKILNKDGKIDKDELVSQLKTLKTIGDIIGIIDEYKGDEKYINNELNLASEIELVLIQAKGFFHSIMPIGMVELIKGSYTVFENSFTPSCELGINQTSGSKELAKEFIALVLSEEVQKDDLYDGFSVNKKAMHLSFQEDQSNIGAGVATSVKNEDGSEEVYFFDVLSKEQRELLIQNCSTISNRIIENEPIIAILKGETGGFFQGNLSAEQTAENIMERANIYLSE